MPSNRSILMGGEYSSSISFGGRRDFFPREGTTGSLHGTFPRLFNWLGRLTLACPIYPVFPPPPLTRLHFPTTQYPSTGHHSGEFIPSPLALDGMTMHEPRTAVACTSCREKKIRCKLEMDYSYGAVGLLNSLTNLLQAVEESPARNARCETIPPTGYTQVNHPA